MRKSPSLAKGIFALRAFGTSPSLPQRGGVAEMMLLSKKII
jgi:hypothetical protein